MNMLPVLGCDDIDAMQISVEEIRETVASALIALGDSGTECPRKLSVSGPSSVSYAMLARLGPQELVGFKTSYTHWSDAEQSSGKSYATSLLICDELSGQPLVWMDAGRVGALRTSAVTALLAASSCVPDPTNVLIIGTGTQGQGTIKALASVMPSLTDVFIAGTHPDGMAACVHNTQEAGLTAHCLSPQDARRTARDCQLVIGAAGPHSPVLVAHEDLSPGTSTVIVGTGIGPSCVAEADLLVATSTEQMQLTGTDLAADDGTLRIADVEFPTALRNNMKLRKSSDQNICCYNSGLVVTDIALGALIARRALRDVEPEQKVRMW